VPGLFVLDKQIVVQPDGGIEIDVDLSNKLDLSISAFVTGLRRAAHGVTDN
jgi:hypothetical protein